jgi:hypothetical protein
METYRQKQEFHPNVQKNYKYPIIIMPQEIWQA